MTKEVGVLGFGSLLHQMHLLVVVRRTAPLAFPALVAALPLQNGGAPAAASVDGLAHGATILGDDQGQFAGADAIHHFIHRNSQQKVDQHPIDDPIHIPEQNTACQHDEHIGQKGDLPQGQIGLERFDRQMMKSDPPVEELRR